MYKYGKTSQKRKATVHSTLQLFLDEFIKYIDVTIVCGFRTEEEQNKAYPKKSTKQWPNSKHNRMVDGKPCSTAVDIAPWIKGGIPWKDERQFYFMLGRAKQLADLMGIGIRIGGDWDGDNDVSNQTFDDLVHIELTGQERQPNVIQGIESLRFGLDDLIENLKYVRGIK